MPESLPPQAPVSSPSSAGSSAAHPMTDRSVTAIPEPARDGVAVGDPAPEGGVGASVPQPATASARSSATHMWDVVERPDVTACVLVLGMATPAPRQR